MNNKEFLLSTLKTAFKTITPWKKKVNSLINDFRKERESLYIEGWNDCIKEIKKNRAKYIKFIETKL